MVVDNEILDERHDRVSLSILGFKVGEIVRENLSLSERLAKGREWLSNWRGIDLDTPKTKDTPTTDTTPTLTPSPVTPAEHSFPFAILYQSNC